MCVAGLKPVVSFAASIRKNILLLIRTTSSLPNSREVVFLACAKQDLEVCEVRLGFVEVGGLTCQKPLELCNSGLSARAKASPGVRDRAIGLPKCIDDSVDLRVSRPRERRMA